MKPLVIPTVNLNGNDAASLVEDCTRIMRALREAKAIIACGHDLWHGRNFQTAKEPFSAQADAANAIRERAVTISKMAAEFEDLAVAIQRQGR